MTTVFGPTVKADVLRGYVASLLVTTGYTATDAQEIADALVEADLRGVVSHGTMHVPNLLKRTKLGLVNTRPSTWVRPLLRFQISGQRLPSPRRRCAMRHTLSYTPSVGGRTVSVFDVPACASTCACCSAVIVLRSVASTPTGR